jgi:diaminopimelate epimerase
MEHVTLTYGHGTENDFLLLLDEADQIQVTPEAIKKFCDRATGIGADGFIRMVKRDGHWFMDYRNSDGSLAEMCGNGIRVMARYLVDHGLQGAGLFPIDSRDGKKFLAVPEAGEISVNLGKVEDLTPESAEISIKQNGRIWPALHIDVGNPHAVVFVDSLDEVGSLANAPEVTPTDAFPEGTNVEFVEKLEGNEVRMRVHERGSGETKSCGTGVCAVALATTVHEKKRLPAQWIVHVPGGTLKVEIDGHSNAVLTGPAVLISEHEVSL